MTDDLNQSSSAPTTAAPTVTRIPAGLKFRPSAAFAFLLEEEDASLASAAVGTAGADVAICGTLSVVVALGALDAKGVYCARIVHISQRIRTVAFKSIVSYLN